MLRLARNGLRGSQRRGSGQFVKPEAIPRRTSGLLGLQKRSWFHTVETLEAQQFACLDCETKEVAAEPVEKLRGKLELKATPASLGEASQRPELRPSKNPDPHAQDYSDAIAQGATLGEVKLQKLTSLSPSNSQPSNLAWGQPPRLSRQGEARRLRAPLRAAANCALILLCSVLPAFGVTWNVKTQPTRLVNGTPVLFQVKPPSKLQSLTGTWLGHQLKFSYDASTKTWFTLAGVTFETIPGKYALELSAEQATTKAAMTFTPTFVVAHARYPQIKVNLTVEKKFTEPSPEQQQQIAEGVKIKEDYLNRVTPSREWDGKFTAPADAAISDVYGSQRIFNGKAQRPHWGLDFRVPTGTPVAAMNSGTVLLARFLYFEGNCVVIDHGQGLLTLYFHLSALKVKEGDAVKRGEEIGLSGGTGRATGPHLHVAVRWQGTYLDPARLIQLSLP
jgi:murein DD-endopeptidase MepM/ murein hydrolase activator NlpD